MSVVEEVRGFLARDLSIQGAHELAPDLPLVQKGVIDSIELMQIVLFLENRYGIRVHETEVLPANFRSLSAMEAFVEQKRSGGPA